MTSRYDRKVVCCTAIALGALGTFGCEPEEVELGQETPDTNQGGNAAGGAGGASQGGTGGFQGGAGGVGPTVEVSTYVQDAVTSSPIADAQVCIYGVPQIPCGTTDADGHTTIDAPEAANPFVAITKTGYVSALLGIAAKYDTLLVAPILNTTLAGVVASDAGITVDESKGSFVLASLGPPPSFGAPYPGVADVTFAMTPNSPEGPHYVNSLFFIDPNLTATGDKGGALFFNATGGDYEFTATHPSVSCAALAVHPGSTADTFAVKAVAGYATYASVVCK